MINPVDFDNIENLPKEFLEEMTNNAGEENGCDECVIRKEGEK